jgi:hypothetical protein
VYLDGGLGRLDRGLADPELGRWRRFSKTCGPRMLTCAKTRSRPQMAAYLSEVYGHLFPEVNSGAAAELGALRNFGLPTGAEVY